MLGTETVELFAKVDTGADYCVFSRGYAEALLIDVDTGIAQRFSTAAGEFRAFGHEVRLEVLGIGVGVIVYFYENPESTRNVLGRNGWLNQVRFGLVDYDSLVYFSHYDE